MVNVNGVEIGPNHGRVNRVSGGLPPEQDSLNQALIARKTSTEFVSLRLEPQPNPGSRSND